MTSIIHFYDEKRRIIYVGMCVYVRGWFKIKKSKRKKGTVRLETRIAENKRRIKRRKSIGTRRTAHVQCGLPGYTEIIPFFIRERERQWEWNRRRVCVCMKRVKRHVSYLHDSREWERYEAREDVKEKWKVRRVLSSLVEGTSIYTTQSRTLEGRWNRSNKTSRNRNRNQQRIIKL